MYLAVSSDDLQEAFVESEIRKRKITNKRKQEEEKQKEEQKEKEKKQKEEQEKQKEEEEKRNEKSLLYELRKDLRNEVVFRILIGDLDNILNFNHLPIPQAFEFLDEDRTELENLRKSCKKTIALKMSVVITFWLPIFLV